MLTDKALGALKPKDKVFKVTDRDGMYVAVLRGRGFFTPSCSLGLR